MGASADCRSAHLSMPRTTDPAGGDGKQQSHPSGVAFSDRQHGRHDGVHTEAGARKLEIPKCEDGVPSMSAASRPEGGTVEQQGAECTPVLKLESRAGGPGDGNVCPPDSLSAGVT